MERSQRLDAVWKTVLMRRPDAAGKTYLNARGTWNNVIVQAKYKIHLSEGIALANNKENILYYLRVPN